MAGWLAGSLARPALQNIIDEEGFKRAYDTKDGLYQHYNKLSIAGTKDFPQDHIDDLKLPFDASWGAPGPRDPFSFLLLQY